MSKLKMKKVTEKFYTEIYVFFLIFHVTFSLLAFLFHFISIIVSKRVERASRNTRVHSEIIKHFITFRIQPPASKIRTH